MKIYYNVLASNVYGPANTILVLIASFSIEGSEYPAYTGGLAKAFSVFSHT